MPLGNLHLGSVPIRLVTQRVCSVKSVCRNNLVCAEPLVPWESGIVVCAREGYPVTSLQESLGAG